MLMCLWALARSQLEERVLETVTTAVIHSRREVTSPPLFQQEAQFLKTNVSRGKQFWSCILT
jgi:hypothetical protein